MPVIDQYARLLSARTRKPVEIAQILDEFFLARLNEIEHEVDELSVCNPKIKEPIGEPAADIAEVKARSGKKNMKVPKVQ